MSFRPPYPPEEGSREALEREIKDLRKACERKDDALRACRAIIGTPIAQRKFAAHWDEYWEDATRRIIAEVGTMG